ncbi:MAG: 6-phosphofructokinase [Cytophagales bacterium]|nr:6-phosphofructokinase [Cytophagales bacterium]
MKKIAVFTSGGDAPGMNACIRAVVRSAIHYGLEVVGVVRGYDGMINGSFTPMTRKSVSNIIQKGGTMLKSARSEDFRTKEGRAKAYKQIRENGIEGIVAIGGNGTFTGAKLFYDEYKIPIIGAPGTIDNDLYGSDFTIGYDTAVNTSLDAIDKIRDTADAHDRVFFIEVMGRDTGYIAVRSGIGGGAEMAIIPENNTTSTEIVEKLKASNSKLKGSHIIVVAEGDVAGKSVILANEVKEALPELDTKVSILGHIQRGGAPTAADRVLASRLGVGAVEGLIHGQKNVMVGVINHEVVYTSLEDAIEKKKPVNQDIVRIIDVLNGRTY